MTLKEQFKQENYKKPLEPYSASEDAEEWTSIVTWQENYIKWLETKLNNTSINNYPSGFKDNIEYAGTDKELKILYNGKVWYIRKDTDGVEISSNQKNWYLLSENKNEFQLNEIIDLEN